MNVPAAILAIVLAEAGVGGLVILWLSPTWGSVRHGFEILLGGTLALMLLGAWAALRGPLGVVADSAASDGTVTAVAWTGRGLATAAAVAGLSVLALLARRPTTGRVLGTVGAVVGLATFVPLAVLRAAGEGAGGAVTGFVELALGAFFLGAVWDGLVLGHWYLVERRLSNRYMVWMSWVNVGAVVAGLAAVLLSATNPVPCAGLSGDEAVACGLGFSPLLSVGRLTIMMGVGVVALVAIIAGFNVRLAREGGRSIQASTGMFYLAVILAPAAEFAAKVRFF